MKIIDVFAMKQKEILDMFTIEFCPWCNADQIIFAHGTTKCPDCGHVLIPCSVCIDMYGDCLGHEECPYKEVEDTPEEKKVATNVPINLTEEEQAFIYKHL